MQKRIDGIVVRGPRKPRSSPENPKTKPPKKPKKLRELAEAFSSGEMENLAGIEVKVLRDLKSELSEIEDPREQSYVWHNLSDIIMIALLSVLSGCDEWYQIPLFAKRHIDWFEKFLNLPNGIPTENTIELVISKVKINELYNIVLNFLINRINDQIRTATLNETCSDEEDEREIISIDGKVSRGSKRNSTDQKEKHNPLNTLNAYSSQLGMAAAQEFMPDKKSEIEFGPKILKKINIEGALVTADALNTQAKTVEAIVDGGADYVLPVKGNQKTLYGDLTTIFDEPQRDRIRENEDNTQSYKQAIAREKGSIIKREYFLLPVPDGLYKASQWRPVNTIGNEHKTIERINVKTNEKETVNEDRYYINSINSVDDFARAVRDHWGVENGLHWHLDYTFKDDHNKTIQGNGAEGLQIFKKLALSILKIFQAVSPKYMSLNKIRFMIGLSFNEMIASVLDVLGN
jgi:predicted transposase YbfD/YdcC